VAGDAPARSISIGTLKCAHLRPRNVAWGFHMMELVTRHKDQSGKRVCMSLDTLK
jgi:hypothetical protein